MIILDQTTRTIEALLSGAPATNQLPIVASYVDVTPTTYAPGANITVTNSATAVTAVAAPAASTQRQVKFLAIRNDDTAAVTLTLRYNDNGTFRKLWSGTLAVGDTFQYVDGLGIGVVDAAGGIKQTAGRAAASVIELSCTQRVLVSDVDAVGTLPLVSGTAYFVYLGRAVVDFVAKFVEFHVTVAGAGAQTAEVGLFSSPQPPNKANQSLTKLAATGVVDALTGAGVKRNTGSLAQAISAGTHLWAGIRTAMATTQPTITALGIGMGQGTLLSAAASGVLTGAGPFAGVVIAGATGAECPELRVTLD